MKTLLLTMAAALGLASSLVFANTDDVDSSMIQQEDMIVLICHDGNPMICQRQDPNAVMESNPTAAGKEMTDYSDPNDDDDDDDEDF